MTDPEPSSVRPLRVLEMNTTWGVGGISRHVLELSDWLKARGHQVRYAGTPGPWMGPDRDPDFLTLPTQKVSGEGSSTLMRPVHALTAAARLRAWLKANPVDLIHAHESAPALVARLATLGTRTPIALTFHGSEPERFGQYGKIAGFSADRVISVSHKSGRDLISAGGMDAAKIQVIGLGVKPAPAIDPARAAKVRADLLGETGRFLAVTIARLTHQKGIDVLVEVARRVVAEQPDIHFAVVGDGDQEADAKAWAKAVGVEDHVHFVGRSEEPHLYLAAADLFLLTSRWEALPFTIAEAFQTGTPAVATDCGGVAELIDEIVGRVVPIGDPDAIAAAVLDIAADEPARQAMAATALARSREDRFKPDHIHRQIEAAYADLISRKGQA